MRLALSLLVVAAALNAADFYYPVPADSQVEIRRNVIYAQSGGKDLAMDFYRPARLASGERVPIVIFLNALGGPQREWPIYVGWAKAAVGAGMAAVNADPPQEEAARESAFDSLLDYIAKNSASLGVDAGRSRCTPLPRMRPTACRG